MGGEAEKRLPFDGVMDQLEQISLSGDLDAKQVLQRAASTRRVVAARDETKTTALVEQTRSRRRAQGVSSMTWRWSYFWFFITVLLLILRRNDQLELTRLERTCIQPDPLHSSEYETLSEKIESLRMQRACECDCNAEKMARDELRANLDKWKVDYQELAKELAEALTKEKECATRAAASEAAATNRDSQTGSPQDKAYTAQTPSTGRGSTEAKQADDSRSKETPARGDKGGKGSKWHKYNSRKGEYADRKHKKAWKQHKRREKQHKKKEKREKKRRHRRQDKDRRPRPYDDDDYDADLLENEFSSRSQWEDSQRESQDGRFFDWDGLKDTVKSTHNDVKSWIKDKAHLVQEKLKELHSSVLEDAGEPQHDQDDL